MGDNTLIGFYAIHASYRNCLDWFCWQSETAYQGAATLGLEWIPANDADCIVSNNGGDPCSTMKTLSIVYDALTTITKRTASYTGIKIVQQHDATTTFKVVFGYKCLDGSGAALSGCDVSLLRDGSSFSWNNYQDQL